LINTLVQLPRTTRKAAIPRLLFIPRCSMRNPAGKDRGRCSTFIRSKFIETRIG